MKAFIFLLILFYSQLGVAQTASLTIVINGIEPIKGRLEIGIYNRADVFPEVGKQYKQVFQPVWARTEKVKVSLPIGEYAVAVYHDEDTNGKCDKNFIGIPTEAYGFLLNFKLRFSAPGFDDAKFKLKRDTTIVIDLIH